MLKLAIKAGIPLIGVTTTDVLNVPVILHHLTGKKPVRWSSANEKAVEGQLYFYIAEGKPPVRYDKLYDLMVKSDSTLVVVNSPVESDLLFVGGDVPVPKDLLRKQLLDVFDDAPLVDKLIPALGGCTLKDSVEFVRLTMARDKALTAEGLMVSRKAAFKANRGIQLVDTSSTHYAPPKHLEDWANREGPFFLKETDLRLVPRGLLFGGIPGTGKCLAPDEPVLMYDGAVRRTDSLVPGDQLMGPDSAPRTVLSVSTGHGPMYEVRPTKGRPWRCNGDHVLSLRKTRNPDAGSIVFTSVEEWLTWSDSKKNGYKLWRTGVDFPERREPLIAPYFVGLVLGDGTVNENVAVTTVDPEVVAYLKTVAAQHGLELTKRAYRNRTPSYALTLGNIGQNIRGLNPVLRKLRHYGLEVPCGDKFIPEDYKRGSRSTRLQVLAGLMDSDGHLYQSGGYDFISKSRRLAEDTAFVARSLGLAAYVKAVEKTCTTTGGTGVYWRVSISGHVDEVPCLVPRKKASPRKQVKNVTNTGFTIEPVGEGDWFGITLDGDHQYLLGDFTVTHNTEGAKWIAQTWGVPLYRVDVGGMRQKYVGQSEQNMTAALSQLDHEEPCVALFDEIEKVFSTSHGGGDSGTTTTMLSQLLWWLAERRTRVLVVMTCNDRKKIPPELYRDGRIDDVVTFNGLQSKEEVFDFAEFVLAGFGLSPGDLPKGLLESKLLHAIKTKASGTGTDFNEVSHAAIKKTVIDCIKEAKA